MEWIIFLQKAAISTFMILVALLLLFWGIPGSYFLEKVLPSKVGRYICWAALDTYWALFAPDPVSKNFLLGFEIEFRDGTVRPWKLAEYTQANGYQVAAHFRYIKMHNQWLSQKDPVARESICKFVHREFHRQNQKAIQEVKKIHIVRFYEAGAGPLSPIPWLSQRIFTFDTTILT